MSGYGIYEAAVFLTAFSFCFADLTGTIVSRKLFGMPQSFFKEKWERFDPRHLYFRHYYVFRSSVACYLGMPLFAQG